MTTTNMTNKNTCCDGECNHDDCCGKIPENCTHKENMPDRPMTEGEKEIASLLDKAFEENMPESWEKIVCTCNKQWLDDNKHYANCPVFIMYPVIAQERAKAVSERVENWGFYDLVFAVKLMLESRYPLDIFDGSSGDIGPRFTAKLHEAMEILPPEARSREESTTNK